MNLRIQFLCKFLTIKNYGCMNLDYSFYVNFDYKKLRLYILQYAVFMIFFNYIQKYRVNNFHEKIEKSFTIDC
jgi:hypothetical protein